MIVVAKDGTEILAVAKSIQGQLTCSIHMEEADSEAARTLLPVLERKAARLLTNSFPTGIEVCDAMVHGGPCPASTNFGATSVCTMAVRRFLRPVCYQNLPEALLPESMSGYSKTLLLGFLACRLDLHLFKLRGGLNGLIPVIRPMTGSLGYIDRPE